MEILATCHDGLIYALHLRTMAYRLRKAKIVVLTCLLTAACLLLILNLKNPQKELSYKIEAADSVTEPHFAKVLGDLMGPPLAAGNRIQTYYNGDEIFPAMLEGIHSATKTITFESFIYWAGDIGDQFVIALSESARRGVKVHVLIDWLGSNRIENSYVERLKDAGVEVELYHPLKWFNISRMNNRTHRKLLIIDGRIGFTGGVGIADEWSGNGEDAKHWRDTHFRVEGPVVSQMQAAFMDNWLKARPEVHQSTDYFPELTPVGTSLAQMFKSSSREGASSVRIMYLIALAAAKKTIHIESAYFAPDELAIDELIKAKHRGVNVEIIVPKLTDSRVIKHASRAIWGRLLKEDIAIFEYQPALFHCKILIVDSYFTSVGSTNFDERSFRLNDEANLNVLDTDFADHEIAAFEKDKGHSQRVTLAKWEDRSIEEKAEDQASVLFRSQL